MEAPTSLNPCTPPHTFGLSLPPEGAIHIKQPPLLSALLMATSVLRLVSIFSALSAGMSSKCFLLQGETVQCDACDCKKGLRKKGGGNSVVSLCRC